tara:strand:- start:40 stop:231 length:192 start_codon:yes stop_codon:yes gene_type:complete
MAFPTNPIYKFIKEADGKMKQVKKIVTDTEGSFTMFIPFVEDNRDYQEYLAWVAEGNTAEAAD